MKSKNAHRDSLSRKEITSYLKGGTPEVQHEIEKKSLQSNFDSDALDGWSTSGLLPKTSLKELDKRFLSSNTSLFFLALSSLFIIATLLIAHFYNQKSADTTQIVQLTIEESDLNLPSALDSVPNITPQQQVQPSIIIEDFEAKKKTIDHPSSNPSKKMAASEVTVNDLPLLSLDLPQPIATEKHSESAKEIYLADLKLIDYRAYRSKPEIQTRMLVLSGVPANLENENAHVDEMEYKEIDIPYIDYIEKTMRIFGKEDYKKVLARTTIILQTYPDDLNALFYSGLCHYNLGQYDTALDQFYSVLNHRYSNFNEEAEWYLALSYWAKGEKQKAKSIFEMIVKNDNYYSKQAKAYL